jgi:hypothetical protein
MSVWPKSVIEVKEQVMLSPKCTMCKSAGKLYQIEREFDLVNDYCIYTGCVNSMEVKFETSEYRSQIFPRY